MIQEPILLDLPLSITAKRLVIRPVQPGDGAKMFEAIEESRQLFEKWFEWTHYVKTPKDLEKTAREFYAKFILRDEFHFISFYEEKLVCSASFHKLDWKTGSAEIGYWCKKSAHGQGFVIEMVNALVEYAFQEMGLKRLSIVMDEENYASIRVAEAAGFTLEIKAKGLCAKPGVETLRLGRRYIRLAE
ncbi:GNAT family N-acetyltransferase [Candidatus Paracaedibacter symbiosus]|uniref:GNAT family N-acetyltransferase n=1 Tax=Candidatus Paracaedibacter symbiosus TaxID=244582 RepID=UPI00068D5086|nr:GNAT family N-acetyltransferase [Candidatus Paracaedibacter symbiosus]